MIGQEFYDADYYVTGDKALHGGYKDCHKGWKGWTAILKAIEDVLGISAATILDVGCGVGTFIREAVARKHDAYGFDFSEWAIDNNCLYESDRERVSTLSIIDESCPDIASILPRHPSITACFSVLEHLPASEIPIAIRRLSNFAEFGYLIIQVDLLDKSLPGASDIDENVYRYCGESNDPLHEYHLAAGHDTILPWQDWDNMLREHSGLAIRNDIRDAIMVRAGLTLGWDNLFVLGPNSTNKRFIVWSIDQDVKLDVITDSLIHERMHHGNIVGAASHTNVRDQIRAWYEEVCVPPDFALNVSALHTLRWRFPQATEFIHVGQRESLPEGFMSMSPEEFIAIRPQPRY